MIFNFLLIQSALLMDLKINSFLEEIEGLLKKCDNQFAHIDGSIKLKRKLEAEKKFLNSVNFDFKLIRSWNDYLSFF